MDGVEKEIRANNARDEEFRDTNYPTGCLQKRIVQTISEYLCSDWLTVECEQLTSKKCLDFVLAAC